MDAIDVFIQHVCEKNFGYGWCCFACRKSSEQYDEDEARKKSKRKLLKTNSVLTISFLNNKSKWEAWKILLEWFLVLEKHWKMWGEDDAFKRKQWFYSMTPKKEVNQHCWIWKEKPELQKVRRLKWTSKSC
jgi:hypothetical protein